MNQASVGFHCPECTRAGAQRTIPARVAMRRGASVVTNALIALNLAIFVAGMGSGLNTRDEFVGWGGLVGEGRRLGDLWLTADADVGEWIGVAHGEWWRIVSSGFLHANLLHVAMNCLVLYQLGQILEPLLGRARFALVYAVSMLGGSFGALLVEPEAFTVGASGAVFGLMGVMIAIVRSRGVNIFDTSLGGLVMMNLVITFLVPGISVGGHVGGLVAGLAAGTVVVAGRDRRIEPQVAATAAVALGVALAAGSLLVA